MAGGCREAGSAAQVGGEESCLDGGIDWRHAVVSQRSGLELHRQLFGYPPVETSPS